MSKKLSDYQPQKRNANKHTPRGMGLLQKSIENDGFIGAMTAANDGEIIAGSARLEKSAEVFGLDAEPIVVETDGTRPIIVKRTDIATAEEPRAKRLALADNRVQEVDLEWDTDVLQGLAEFDDVDLGEWWSDKELKDIGVEFEKPEAPAPQIDRAEELREKWGVETGQLWRLGDHRLICGDCTDADVVALVMDGEKADCVVTDPPYGVAIGDKNKFLNSFQPSGRNLENIAGDLMGKDELFDMLVRSFTLTREHMKDECAIYVTAPQGGELGMMMMMMMMMSRLPVRHVLNWVKNSPTFSLGRLDYEYKHEPILYTWKKTHKHRGAGKHKNSVWEIDKPRASKEHPTMKPVELYENAYLNSSDAGNIIYEPFSGSGTAIIACENLNRKCRAVEISPAYVAVALERWHEMTGQMPELLDT